MPSLGDVAAQSAELAKGTAPITTALGVTPTNFIPPTNRCDVCSDGAERPHLGFGNARGRIQTPLTTGPVTAPQISVLVILVDEPQLDGRLPENTVARLFRQAWLLIRGVTSRSPPTFRVPTVGSRRNTTPRVRRHHVAPRELAADRCEGGSNAALNEEKVAAIKAIIAKGKELNWTFTTLTGLSATSPKTPSCWGYDGRLRLGSPDTKGVCRMR